MKKIPVSLLTTMALIICCPILAFAQDDPAAPTVSQETPSPRYSAAEFDALPDDVKKEVYFNEAQLLPENFDMTQYQNLFHGEAQ